METPVPGFNSCIKENTDPKFSTRKKPRKILLNYFSLIVFKKLLIAYKYILFRKVHSLGKLVIYVCPCMAEV